METSKDTHAGVADALKKQRKRGFTWLSFEPHLERGFQLDYAEQGLPFRLTLIGFSLIAVLGIIILDNLVLPIPEGLFNYSFPLQVFAIMPALLLAVWVTWHERWRRYSEFALLLAVFNIALATGVMRAVGAQESFQVPLEYTTTVIAAVFFLGWVPFWRFLPIVVLLTIMMLFNEWWFVGPMIDGWYRVSVNLMLITVSVAGGYSFEYVVRQSWLNSRLLEQLSNHDPLTGLLNRRAFSETAGRGLRQAIREKKVIGLALLDIDHFKLYNDNYGHPAGDVCLEKVAAVLQSLAKRPLDACSRYGGEEFVVAWFDADVPTLESLAEEALTEIRALQIPHAFSPVGSVLTASLGLVTIRPSQATTLEQLLEQADRAMYRAKQQGRDRMVVEHCSVPNAQIKTAAGEK